MTNKPETVGYLVVGDFENHCHVHYQLHRTEQAAAGLADHWRMLGGDVTNDPLIRLADHESARAADKARIAELESALIKMRSRAEIYLNDDAAMPESSLTAMADICDKALSQLGKEGEK